MSIRIHASEVYSDLKQDGSKQTKTVTEILMNYSKCETAGILDRPEEEEKKKKVT
jgi:hypothetical protein